MAVYPAIYPAKPESTMRWLLILFFCVACAPQSTRPFDPTEQIGVAEAIAKQGRKMAKDDCYEIYKAEADVCGYSMTLACKASRRNMRRIGKTQSCKMAMSPDNIADVIRAMKKGH